MTRRPTLMLLLLPWLLFGQNAPRRHGVGAEERVFSGAPIVDASSNPAYHVDSSRELAAALRAPRRNPKVAVRHTLPLADAEYLATPLSDRAWTRSSWASTEDAPARPKRLTIPHNATAPPAPPPSPSRLS